MVNEETTSRLAFAYPEIINKIHRIILSGDRFLSQSEHFFYSNKYDPSKHLKSRQK